MPSDTLKTIAAVRSALNGLRGKTVNMTAEQCAELLSVPQPEVYRLSVAGELGQRVRDALTDRRSDAA